MNSIIRACIALAAFAAVAVLPSVASAIEVTHPTGTRAGLINIEATNVAHAGTSKITKMETSLGNVECATATMTGTLTKNDGVTVQGNITTAEFRGTPAEPASAHCAGGFGGNTTVTPNHTTNPEHLGVKSLPWCVTATGAKDEFSVRGGLCSEAARPLTFTLHTSTIGSCSYQKASVTGTYTTHPADAVMTISGQEFTRTTGNTFLCPSSGKLTMAFTLFTDGKPAEPIYISK